MKPGYTLLLLLLLLTSTATAQVRNSPKDSLLVSLQQASSDTTSIKLLNNISEQEYLVGNFDSALKYAVAAKRLAEKIKYQQGIAKGSNNIALVYFYQGKYADALTLHTVALKFNKAVADKVGIATTYKNMGLVYQYQGNYPQALKSYYAALKINEQINDKKGIAACRNNIGLVYATQENNEEALKNYAIALKLSEELDNKRGLAACYNNIGNVYYEAGNYQKALINYFSAKKINEVTGNKNWLGTNYGNIGLVYSAQGEYDEALENYLICLKIKEEIGDINGVITAQIAIGIGYIKTNQAKTGKEWLQKGLSRAQEINAKDLIQNAYNGLSQADSVLGNYKSAYRNYKLYVIYRDSLLNAESAIKQSQTEMQFEFDKKESLTRAAQDKKDAILQQKLQQQKIVRNSLIGGFTVVLLFAGVFLRQRNKIAKGKKRSDDLLLNILPVEVADELKQTGTSEAKLYNNVTVLFTDFVNFTGISEQLSPTELVAEIHKNFTAFDAIIEKHGLEKIKTIGDAYLAVCGLPHESDSHAQRVVEAALEICSFIQKSDSPFQIRIGINSGPVVAGIVGVKKYAYDIWGDTVNTAARMEQHSEAGKINISGATYQLVKDSYTCTSRGKIQAKNKGEIEMYFINHTV